jgi:hypothetical protein
MVAAERGMDSSIRLSARLRAPNFERQGNEQVVTKEYVEPKVSQFGAGEIDIDDRDYKHEVGVVTKDETRLADALGIIFAFRIAARDEQRLFSHESIAKHLHEERKRRPDRLVRSRRLAAAGPVDKPKQRETAVGFLDHLAAKSRNQ